MSEPTTDYHAGIEPDWLACPHCGKVLGAIGQDKMGRRYVWRWADKVYRGEFTCDECGRVVVWP